MSPAVCIGLPFQRGQIESENLQSLMAMRRDLFSRHIQHHILTNESSVISASRNSIAERLMHEYLMWIDSDMLFPPWGVARLVSRGLDIVGGLYFRKSEEAEPLVFKYDEKGNHSQMFSYPKDELFEVDAIATGFLLIHRKVFAAFTPEVQKEIGAPFDIGRGANGREEGEDFSFCRRAKKLGFKIWCDPTIPLGHIGTYVYRERNFEEWIAKVNWLKKKYTYDNSIEGWMTNIELGWLCEIAASMESIVEIGSWKGRSTHALLSGAPKAVVYAVDTWKGSAAEIAGPHKEATERDIFEDFWKNVGEFPNLKVMRGESVETAALFPDKSIDMVFIDAGHTYAEVKADIQAWLPKTKKLLCGHDYQIHDVQEAVTECLGNVDTAESIWIKQIKEKKDEKVD